MFTEKSCNNVTEIAYATVNKTKCSLREQADMEATSRFYKI